MILATTVLFECGPKQFSEFTLEHPANFSILRVRRCRI